MHKIWLNALWRLHGESYRRYLVIKEIDTKEKLAAFQSGELTRLLSHCNEHVPYYRALFKQVGLIRDGCVELSRFTELPLLDKETIRTNWNDLISDDYGARKWYYNSSGGSTGEPVRFIQDAQYQMWGRAVNHYYYKQFLDVEPADRKLIIWGSTRDLESSSGRAKEKIYNRLSNTVFFNAFMMKEEDMETCLRLINSYKPRLLRGYANALYELGRFIQKKHKRVFTPSLIVSSAETLQPEMRATIESAFGAPVYDFYGSRETSNLAGECKEGKMHAFTFWNNIELLDADGTPTDVREDGRVVVSCLFNYSMPLVRYEIGDIAVRGTEKCRCGSILPAFDRVSGRISEHFLTKDGSVINGGYFRALFYYKDWIKQFQITQEDHDRVTINAVLRGPINVHEKRDIEVQMRRALGENSKVTWNLVDDLPVSENGKFLHVISPLWQQRA